MAKKNHRSTSRILDVLELISENANGYSLTEICEAIDAPKSSMSPILHTLLDREFLSFDKDKKKYYIARMAFQVGNSYLENLDIIDEIEKELQNIVNVCEETAHFGILVDGDVFYLKKIDSPKSIRMISTVGKKIPAYGTAIGKSLLIDYSLSDLKKLYPDGLHALTESTITDLNILEKQLKKARIEGFTYEIEESNQYIRCISMPLRNKEKVIAGLSVAIPVFRYTEEKATLIENLLSNAKDKIETILKNVDTNFSNFL